VVLPLQILRAPPEKAPHLFAITPLVGRRSALVEVLKEHGGVACTPYSPQLVDATGGGTLLIVKRDTLTLAVSL